jgi:CheY-like chemotaxis protein
LKGCGFSTEAVTHPAHVLRALEAGPFDAVLLDLNYTRDTTAGEGGLELVSQIRSDGARRLGFGAEVLGESAASAAVQGVSRAKTELKIARPIRKHKIFGQSTTNDFP